MKIDKANEIVLVMNIADACFLLGMMDVPLGCFYGRSISDKPTKDLHVIVIHEL